MQINIKTVKGDSYKLDVNQDMKIEEVKLLVQKKGNVEPDFQKLIFKGKHLANEKTLTELNVKDGDNFILMILKVN